MTVTDLDLVNIAASCYDPSFVWDVSVNTPEGIWLRLKKLNGFNIIAFPGSSTIQDWFEDFQAWTVDSRLGRVERGFFTGLELAWERVKPHIDAPLLFTGHSLGAGRATLTTGLAVLDKFDVRGATLFGEPRSGMQPLNDILASITGRSYRNRHDPVCNVPFRLPGFPYKHRWDLSGLDVAPLPDDPWGPLRDHHIQLYQTGVGGLSVLPSYDVGA